MGSRTTGLAAAYDREMRAGDTHGLGYGRVDEDPNVSVLVQTMDATSRWRATRELRAWERHGLQLRAGQRLLDVGCGLGDAALALAEDLGPGGEVVGIDVSASMLTVARERATAAECSIRFSVGDALSLHEPDASFDAARSERTLQWLTDPEAAVAQLARVLRPGGRIGLIDTDWSTLRLDVGDDDIAAKVSAALRVERRRPSNIGSRLLGLLRSAGFRDASATAATQVWTEWDPNDSPAPDGCFSMESLADDLVAAGELNSDDTDGFVATIREAARQGHFFMSLAMFAVIASKAADL
jgi:SAM-dependent methyltransferase